MVRLTQKGRLKLAMATPFWHDAHDILQARAGADTLTANGHILRHLVASLAEAPKESGAGD